MQEIRSSNSAVVTGICDPNKSWTRHHLSLNYGSKLKYLNIATLPRNFCKKLIKNTKRIYYNDPDIRKVTGNRTFWKAVVLLFSNKFSRNKKINLTEKNEIIPAASKLSQVFSNFFSKAVEELKIPSFSNYSHNDSLKKHSLKNHSTISKTTSI